MAIKNGYKILFIYFLIIAILSCKSKETPSLKNEETQNTLNESQQLFLSMRSNADKLVFKKYYLNPNTNILGDYSNPVWMDSTNDLKKIADFNRLLTGIEDRGYSCCGPRHYTISFYRNNNELGYYCVDTSSKNIACLFDESYQTSYHIDLKTWNSYLDNK